MDDHDNCESCGRAIELGDGVYSVASDELTPWTVTICPPCAVALVDEIAHGLPASYFDVLSAAVQRQAGRREAVAP